MTLTLIQDNTDARGQKLFLSSYKVLTWCGLNLICCWELLVWWTSYSLYFTSLIFKESLGDFIEENKYWLAFGYLLTSFFQTRYDDWHYLILQFDTSLNDLDCYSRSQLYEKAKTFALFSLKFLRWFVYVECCKDMLVCWTLCLIFVIWSIFKRGNLTLWNFRKAFLKFGVLSKACKLLSLKLHLMIDATVLYCLIPLCDLIFTQGHRVRTKLLL